MDFLSLFRTESSPSQFVNEEVIKNLPQTVLIEFTIGFTDDGRSVITISSPEYDGILSEAYSEGEAYTNTVDAILTYFEIPKAIANLIEYKMEILEKKSDNVVVNSFTLVHAEAATA